MGGLVKEVLRLEHIWPRTSSDPFDLFNGDFFHTWSSLQILFKK